MENKNEDGSDNELQMDFELEDYDYSTPWQVTSLTRTVGGMELGKIPESESNTGETRTVHKPSVRKEMNEEEPDATVEIPQTLPEPSVDEDLEEEINSAQIIHEKDAEMSDKEESLEKNIVEPTDEVGEEAESLRTEENRPDKEEDDNDENVDEVDNTLPEQNADHDNNNWVKKILLNLSVLILAWILYRAYVTQVQEGEL